MTLNNNDYDNQLKYKRDIQPNLVFVKVDGIIEKKLIKLSGTN